MAGGHSTRRKFSLGLLVGALSLGAAVAAPRADAGAPFPLSPKKPVADLDAGTITGSSEMATTCYGFNCETYIGIVYKRPADWKVITWERITNQAGLKEITLDLKEGKFSYRTAVVDYQDIATPGTCGPNKMKLGKFWYSKSRCANGVTTYVKVWHSPTTTVNYVD